MSNESETLETKYGHAHFKRTMDDGNYGKTEASIMVPFVYDPSGTDEAAQNNELAMKIAYIEAKTAVYKEMQIETKVLDDGTVIELLQANFKGSTVEPTQSTTSAPAQQRSTSGGGGGRSTIKVYKRLVVNGEKVPNPDWLVDQIKAAEGTDKAIKMVNGSYELWDNRGKHPDFGGDGNPKAPWFKDKNGDGAIWPPR